MRAFAAFCSVFRISLRGSGLAAANFLSEKNARPSEKIADAMALSH
ncbi:hypothetical protein JQ594_04295 [Bradyrhizobium manausense]|nr:hypothetical protein [Bradyrhizobium manausense]MBR0685123.1 hypothetical protein [Bradyrhizobium manausense]